MVFMETLVSELDVGLLEEVEREFFSFLRGRPEISDGVIGARDADFVATSRYQDFNAKCGGIGLRYLGKAIENMVESGMIRFEDGFYCVDR